MQRLRRDDGDVRQSDCRFGAPRVAGSRYVNAFMKRPTRASQRPACAGAGARYPCPMNFLMAILACLAVGAILGWGILLTAKGNLRRLIVGFPAYIAAFAKLGRLPGESY